jgi:glycosyltransferase involved in cell wall biosynthesis
LASVEKYRSLNNSEVLIVDDGSRDFRTCEVLEGLRNEGYKIIRQQNQGVSIARNKGLRYSSGDIILFLDDDNRLLSPYLNVGLDVMLNNKELDVVYGDRIEFGLRSRYIEVGQLNGEVLWRGNKIDNCALIRRKYLERCGGYCNQLSGFGFEDWDLWLSGLSHPEGIKLSYLKDACFEYRVRPDSMVGRLFGNAERMEKVMNILSERYGDKLVDVNL